MGEETTLPENAGTLGRIEAAGDAPSLSDTVSMSDGLGNLLRISQKQLEQRSDPERQAYYKQLDTSYHAVVDEFFDLGDQHVMRFQKLTTRHQRWR
ncbi:MAG: hypothetical protein ACE5G0_22715, partial [Rhodothermales bacterium]